MEQARVVAEDDKVRRLHADLRHIIDLQTASLVRGRLHAGRGVLKDVVEHAGRDAHGALVGHGVDALIELADALARQGGQEDDRRVGEVAEVATDLCRLLSHGVRVLVHKVPLVHDDDAGLSGLVGQTGDLCVLLRHALDGVDEDQADVCALNGGDGSEIGIFFNGVIDLGLAPHSGGIDEAVFAEFVFKIAVDGVARRSGDIGDNDALLPENAVEQAGFADIRLADDGNVDDLALVLLLGGGGEVRNAPVEQVAGAVAVDGGDLDGVAEAERIEFVDVGLSRRPREAAVIPFPRPETTPPVTNTYLTAIVPVPSLW